MLKRLWKPWFVYRPSQLLRRVAAGWKPPVPGYVSLATSWGVPIEADPTKMIGHGIVATGVHDLAVSEILARLTDPGDTVIDVGANIGYTTLLMAVAAGPKGTVIAFEPHPQLFGILRRNVETARQRFKIANVDLREIALGERSGTAELELPGDFEFNDGVARIAANPTGNGRTISVPIDTIDHCLAETSATVMKMDIEGYEPQALRGARATLAARRIRHIVFEDHDVEKSEVVSLLQSGGYRVFSFGWSMRGLELAPVQSRSLAQHYESPNFVATLAADDLAARCAPRGWRVLGHSLLRRSS